jgi:hypothetical protein
MMATLTRTRRARVNAGRCVATMGIVLAVAAVLAGCGSSSEGSGTSTSKHGSATAERAVAAAKAVFAQYVKPQPPITVPALPSRPPTGKTIVVMTCPILACVETTDPAVAAAKALGWKVTQVNQAVTGPQAGISAWQQVLANPPQLIAYGEVYPDSQLQKYITEAGAKGIKIAEIAPEGPVALSAKGPIVSEVSGAPVFGTSGRLMGEAVVANAGVGAQTAFFTDPTHPTFLPTQDAFTKVVTQAGGSVQVVDFSLANIGTKVASQVVSYVQSHPTIKYLAFVLNDATAGVPEALKAAGLSGRVKIISRNPSPANIKDIQTGAQWATVLEEVGSSGYRAIDQLARAVMGVPISPQLRDPDGWHMIITKSNVGQSTTVPPTPGSPAAFLKAWHLSG